MESAEKRNSRRPFYLDKNLMIVFAVALLGVLGFSGISPAFSVMVRDLDITPQDIGVLVSIYTLPGIAFTPVLGILADRFGRKRILVPILLLFGVAGGACAFTRDFNHLLLLRFLQGVGASSLVPLTVVMVCDLYSSKERTAAMCYNASVISGGTAVFPAIGGALATFGWYYPFFLQIVAIPVGLIALFSLEDHELRNEKRIKGYFSDVWRSIRNREAIDLFVVSTFTAVVLFGTYLTYYPLFIGYSFEASPFVIGIIISSTFLITSFSSSQIGRSKKVYTGARFIKMSFVLYVLALTIIPFVPNLWLLLIPSAIFGVAHGLNIPGRHMLVAKLATTKERAVFIFINETFFLLGMTLGPLLMGAILSIGGMAAVFYAGASVSIVILLIEVMSIK